MITDRDQAMLLVNVYAATLREIRENKNLESHLADVEQSIIDVDSSISRVEAEGGRTTSFKIMKNDLRYLKYEILERL